MHLGSYTEIKRDPGPEHDIALEKPSNIIPVVICASEERIGGTMATINSIHSNTDASVLFYIVTLREAVKLTRFVASAKFFPPFAAIQVYELKSKLYTSHIWWCGEHPSLWSSLCVSHRQYIEKTKLKGIKYKILEFNPMVLKGKVKPDSSRPDLLHPVSMCCTTHTHTHAHTKHVYTPNCYVDILDWSNLSVNLFAA